VEKTAMFIILMLIVLVAAFDIVTTLVMVVMEKRKDIAILKVMGARDGQILGVFIFQGFVIGLAGILLGVAAGILLAMNVEVVVRFFERVFSLELFPKEIYSLDRFPSKLEVEDMLRVCAMTALACLAATLYPALMALKVEPTEILRYE
jgi:lipoprotein-releasing system permease protein